MEECPFCKKRSELMSLSNSSYIAFTKDSLPPLRVICRDCKELLDKNGLISDPTNTSGFITSKIFVKYIF